MINVNHTCNFNVYGSIKLISSDRYQVLANMFLTHIIKATHPGGPRCLPERLSPRVSTSCLYEMALKQKCRGICIYEGSCDHDNCDAKW